MTLRDLILGVCALAAACGDPYGTHVEPRAVARDKPRFVPGNADGEIAPAIVEHLEAAKERGTRVLVYVGADWCEPCQRFHEAIDNGELDDRLLGVQFVEYDADRDAERLAVAGYDGRLIPRFALPGSDGRFGGTKVEGGTKGDGAVDHIMTRLGPMLRGP
jgi:thiol-disulfide isomerase/thioredoxin